jgi:hypothetical protein
MEIDKELMREIVNYMTNTDNTWKEWWSSDGTSPSHCICCEIGTSAEKHKDHCLLPKMEKLKVMFDHEKNLGEGI